MRAPDVIAGASMMEDVEDMGVVGYGSRQERYRDKRQTTCATWPSAAAATVSSCELPLLSKDAFGRERPQMVNASDFSGMAAMGYILARLEQTRRCCPEKLCRSCSVSCLVFVTTSRAACRFSSSVFCD